MGIGVGAEVEVELGGLGLEVTSSGWGWRWVAGGVEMGLEAVLEVGWTYRLQVAWR